MAGKGKVKKIEKKLKKNEKSACILFCTDI